MKNLTLTLCLTLALVVNVSADGIMGMDKNPTPTPTPITVQSGIEQDSPRTSTEPEASTLDAATQVALSIMGQMLALL